MQRHLLAAALAVATNVLSAGTPAALHATAAVADRNAAHTEAPRPLVSASAEQEETIALALVRPHYPLAVEVQATALTAHVNEERGKRGLAPLARDGALDRFAVAKAVDMAARGYFGHTSPEGTTFQDRMRAGRWATDYVAENIAFDRDEPAAHRAFVNSPPHYRNVIDPNLRRVGVAVVTVGPGQTFYVEDFSR